MTLNLHRRHHWLARPQPKRNALVHLPQQADAATRRAITRELTEVIEQPNLSLVGLCYTVSGEVAAPRSIGATVDLMVSLMEQVHRDHGQILTELVIEVAERPAGHELELVTAVDDALDVACATYRFPRPSVTFMTRPTAFATTSTD
ncbi:decarboxylase [Rhodococcus maanshanensis]|uniref:decarboxylase n=1 Tax=Rhodococcus maanshanensis TaxID=183556 RepID=UPI0022B32B5F|nr:decarboxylase [Rhodococcus maanshanensis]MCZ4557854.1 decarboxylase [Rhodococcus maanshanensis]